MLRAYKYRLYPNKEQSQMFAKTFGCVRFIWNNMLNDSNDFYCATDTLFIPTPAKYKSDYSFLKEVDSLALANAQMNLKKAYQAFFKKNSKKPKFKVKRNEQSYTTNMVNNNIKLLDNHIVIPKIGSVKIKLHRQLPLDSTIKSITVRCNTIKQYYVSILVETPDKPKEVVKVNSFLGLDFSMGEFYIDSEGKIANYPHFYKKTLQKISLLQQIQSKKTEYSKNYYRLQYKINKLYIKLANQRTDFFYKKANELYTQYDAICVEDINLQDMSNKKSVYKYGKSISDNSFGAFRNILNNKGILIKINKYYASTQICSHCGEKHQIELSERTYRCPSCGLVINRDYNAAINIKQEGQREYLKTRSA